MGFTPNGVSNRDDGLYIPGYYCKDIEITESQKSMLISYYNNAHNNFLGPDDYQLLVHNCVTFVYFCLRHIGVVSPTTMGSLTS